MVTSTQRFRIIAVFVSLILVVLLFSYFQHEMRSESLKIVYQFLNTSMFDDRSKIRRIDELLTTTEANTQTTQFRVRGVHQNKEFVGEAFDTKFNPLLQELNLLNVNNVDDDKTLKCRPKFVTGFSDNHLMEANTLMESFAKFFGVDEKIVYVYNLGVEDKSMQDFSNKWSKLIVESRRFNFEKYPTYVKNLFEYRWKALIIAEMLKDTVDCLWWVDAHTQMKKRMNNTLYDQLATCTQDCTKYPWILPGYVSHSIFSTTDVRMKKYLPYPDSLFKIYSELGANVMLVYGTRSVRRDVLRYWVLCALEQDCMALAGQTIYCNFVNHNRYDLYAKCHRYDQAAINIILAWATHFDISKYYYVDVNDAFW